MTRIEFVMPTEITMADVQDLVLDFMDMPHLGSHKLPINQGDSNWLGESLDANDQHERVEATFDLEPSYLVFDSYDQDLFEDGAAEVVRFEQEEELLLMALDPEDTMWRTLRHAYEAGDLTAGEADRMYLALTGAEDMVGLVNYR